jgi:hypothetical protein
MSTQPTVDELRAEAIRLDCLTPAFEQALRFIEKCDEIDATLAGVQRQLREPARCP